MSASDLVLSRRQLVALLGASASAASLPSWATVAAEVALQPYFAGVKRALEVLAQMNVQLGNVISDVMGLRGQKILRAIAEGERDAKVLAKLRNGRIHASEDEIAKSLRGSRC